MSPKNDVMQSMKKRLTLHEDKLIITLLFIAGLGSSNLI